MPLTFLRYFYIGCTLRWLMSSATWPKSRYFRKMVDAFKTAIMSTRRSSGVYPADFVPFEFSLEEHSDTPEYDERKEAKLPRSTYDSLLCLVSSPATPFASLYDSQPGTSPLLSDTVNFARNVKRHGIKFATRTSGLRDSFVLFRDPSQGEDPAFPCAGQISDIFLHGRYIDGQVVQELFLVINEYQSLNDIDATFDPYRQFPDIHTRLFYNDFCPTQRVIPLRDVIAHFAALFCSVEGIDRPCVVARSLDRVSNCTILGTAGSLMIF